MNIFWVYKIGLIRLDTLGKVRNDEISFAPEIVYEKIELETPPFCRAQKHGFKQLISSGMQAHLKGHYGTHWGNQQKAHFGAGGHVSFLELHIVQAFGIPQCITSSMGKPMKNQDKP